MRFLLLILALALLPTLAHAQSETIIYLLRHAETTGPPYEDNPPNPHLSEDGKARAAHLAYLLEHTGITHIYSTNYRRTMQTAQPLSEATGLPITPYNPGALGDFAAQLKQTPGRHVVAGHSNTTPALVHALGGDAGTPIDDASEYDRLYIVIVQPDGEVVTLQQRYGMAGG